MSKDFRQEYEQYMKENTPDLWERIDAGLSEKKTAGPSLEAKLPPRKHVRHIYKVMTAAAALLFAAVLMPFVYNNHMEQQENNAAGLQDMALQTEIAGMPESMKEAGQGTQKDTLPESTADMAGQGTSKDTRPESASDMDGQEIQKDGLPESPAAGQDGIQEQEMETVTENNTGEIQEKMRQEAAKEEAAHQEAAGQEAASAGEVYTVTALGEMAWTERDDTGIQALPVSRVYKVQIQDSDRIIIVAVPEGMSLTLTEGGIYVLTVKAAEKNAGYDYILISVE